MPSLTNSCGESFFAITAVYWQASRFAKHSDEAAVELPDIVLIAGFLFYPPMLVAITKVMSNSGYAPRYGWPAILGLVLGFVCLLRPIWFKPESVCLPLALLLVFGYRAPESCASWWKAVLPGRMRAGPNLRNSPAEKPACRS